MLKNGIKQRTRKPKIEYKCYICQESFAKRKSMANHMRTIHNEKKFHKCNQCERTFSIYQNMLDHISSIHEGKKNYQCEICKNYFISKVVLSRHINKGHVDMPENGNDDSILLNQNKENLQESFGSIMTTS